MSSKLTQREPTAGMLLAAKITARSDLDVDDLREIWQAMHDAAPGGQSEIESLRAQLAAERERVGRLREALEAILSATPPRTLYMGDASNEYRVAYSADCNDPFKRAREALNETNPEQ